MFRGAKKRTFRFGKKNVSFPKVETFRFADYRKIIHMILISALVVVHGDGLLGLTAGIVWIGSWRISINTTY